MAISTSAKHLSATPTTGVNGPIASAARSWTHLTTEANQLGRDALRLAPWLGSNLHRYRYSALTFASGEASVVLAHAKRLSRDYKPGGTHPTDHRPPLYSGLVKRA